HVYKKLLNEVNHTGYAYHVLDVLDCMKANGYELPGWVDQKLHSDLVYLSWVGLEKMFGLAFQPDDRLKKMRGWLMTVLNVYRK
ncbi:hypothetical protein Tcan_16904, partial [Toxocara canis]